MLTQPTWKLKAEMTPFYCLFLLVALSLGVRAQLPIPEEAWYYVNVRPDAFMFWWLYGCTQTPRENCPLVMWLQVSKVSLGDVLCVHSTMDIIDYTHSMIVLYRFTLGSHDLLGVRPH